MFKHWTEIVYNHDNGYLDWLFLLSEKSGNGNGFTLEELFRSPVTEL